jgi:hypothetical protein
MTVKAVRESEMTGDDFLSLEEKVYRTIELLKAARESAANAERNAGRLRDQLSEQEEETVRLRQEVISLRPDRKDGQAN